MGNRVLLLHYTTPSVLGGVEQVMAVHAAALRDAGTDVAIVAGRGSPGPRGVPLVRIPEIDSRHPAVLRNFRALARGDVRPVHRELVVRLTGALRPHVAEAARVVVHNAFTLHKNHALTEALELLAGEFPGRLIAWTHDLAWADPQYAAERHPGEPWERFARLVPGVRYVTVSRARARQLAELTGTAEDAIAVVPNGLDVTAALALSPAGARLRQRLRLDGYDPVVLVPARITRRKRIEVAIDAARALRERGLAPALIVTAGPGAHNATNRAYLDELRSRADGVAGIFLFHDLGIRVSDRLLADLYALADILLLPSQSEGFGIPILEAGFHRIAIVCSDLPPLRELAGSRARYVPPDADGSQVAEAIVHALANDRAAALRRDLREYSWERILPRVLDTIRDGTT